MIIFPIIVNDVIEAIGTEIVDQPEWKTEESTIKKLTLSYSHPSVLNNDTFWVDEQMEGG